MTIQTIEARTNHPDAPDHHRPLYCFDAPELGLVAEPFVASASIAIHCALRWHHGFEHFTDEAGAFAYSPSVRLLFSSDPDDLEQLTSEDQPVLRLDLITPKDGGHLYDWELIHPESALEDQAWESLVFDEPAWLCPVLLQYFPDGAPQILWVQVSETCAPHSEVNL